MTPTWAAIVISAVGVAVSAAVVVTNVFAVRRAARTQLQIANGQRIGDRQIATYLDLLKWVREIENTKRELGILEMVEVLTLPEDLDDRTTAFASDTVRQRVEDFRDARSRLSLKLTRDKQRLIEVFAEAARTKDYGAVKRAVPEDEVARDALKAVRDSIRHELLGKPPATRARAALPRRRRPAAR